MAAVPRGDLEGLVDVVDGEGDAVHADLVGTGGLRLDRIGVDVLEELEATLTVGGLEHRDVGVVAVEADGSVGPLATDRVAADDRETEVGEEGDRCLEVANGDADVLKFDGHALHATEPARLHAWGVPLRAIDSRPGRVSDRRDPGTRGNVAVASRRPAQPAPSGVSWRRPSASRVTVVERPSRARKRSSWLMRRSAPR